MADFSESRNASRASYPDRAIETHEFKRLEPLITPKELRDRVLFGIPLISEVVDPITKRRQVMSDDLLSDLIVSAVNQLEADSGINIFPVQRTEPHPFDRNLFQQFGYVKLQHTPVSSVDAVVIKPNDNLALYNIPLDWISSSNFINGQINVIPVSPITTTGFTFATGSTGAGAAFLAIIGQLSWFPSWWEITYTSGFADGAIPRIVNELVGCYAAKEVLAMLAATNGASSRSLGMDGLSQSVSTPGPQRYDVRINSLEEKRLRLLGKLRSLYGKKMIMGTL